MAGHAQNLFSLSGKTAIVTGAGGGLGARFASVLSGAGAFTFCIDIDLAAAEKTAQEITAGGGKARAVRCDVSSAAEVAALASDGRAIEADILVNNAGIVTRPSRIHEIAEDDWDRGIRVNLKSTFLCTRAILPSMIAKGGGAIVNLSSILGQRGYYPGFAAVAANYFASKAAIVGFTRQTAAEYARERIRANAICPAFHEGTALGMEYRSLRSAEEAGAFGASVDARTPLGRKGRPEELDGLLLYLVSDASSYVTGQAFAHDGGWMSV